MSAARLYLCVLLTLAACSATHASAIPTPAPLQRATAAPVVTASEKASWSSALDASILEMPPLPASEPDTAAAWLKRGFDLARIEQNAAAAHAFAAALGTGSLNDAGRALAYWHLYLTEQGARRSDAAADALTGFVVVAQDILQIRAALRYAEDGDGDFVDRFDLKRRLARARAILSATWAAQVAFFGRSQAHPIPVHSLAERDYFLELASPCGLSLASKAATPSGAKSGYEPFDLSCSGSPGTRFYFETVADD